MLAWHILYGWVAFKALHSFTFVHLNKLNQSSSVIPKQSRFERRVIEYIFQKYRVTEIDLAYG